MEESRLGTYPYVLGSIPKTIRGTYESLGQESRETKRKSRKFGWESEM